ncbi:hypothetical protein F2Z80_22785 [Vibrio fortis]|uniref:Uncharacterized protein n=1 Tax=Vibrio fortis TaxID=212667 RepID=A0A5N3S4T6_9VIBR|nr:hypothetical protein [Vibrio fortis]KAB0301858.1 hypothetical protein F2Z80_22785 [Vibrio fortis]
MDKLKMDVGIPEGMTISSSFDGMKIERRWFSNQTLFMTVFVVVWDSFLFYWYSNALSSGGFTKENAVTLAFPLIHLAIGVFLTYYVIACYLNKTTVSVSHSFVESKISPVPFGFKKLIPSSSIEQVYCKDVVKKSKDGSSVTFEVRVILKDRKNIRLVSGLELSEQALFLEHEIESYLGIKDVEVKGELS